MAITPGQVDALDLINKVNTFYEVAWVHLMWFIGVAGAIIGVIVPIAIQAYQRRLFKIEESKIDSNIVEQLTKAKADLLTATNERLGELVKSEFALLEKKVNDMEAKLTKEVNRAKGAVYHVQGNEQKTRGVYANAIISFANAAEMQYASDDEMNLQRVLGNLEECLKKLSNGDLTKTPEIESRLSKLMDQLRAGNVNGRYTNYLDKLTRELRRLSA